MPERPSACVLLALALALALGLSVAACTTQARDANAQSASAPAEAATASAPAAPGKTAKSTPAGSSNGLLGLVEALGAHCGDAATGRDCIIGNVQAGDFYDVDLSPSCGDDGFFAGVSADKATLLDTLPVTGSKAQDNASLARDQFLCVQATARSGQQPAYYYVLAIAPDQVAACRGRPICQQYGQRPVQLQAQPRAGSACTASAGHWQGDCARGWISADAVDVFSNGL